MDIAATAVMNDVLNYRHWTGMAIDGGAHVGVWTKALAERFDEVMAFEPAQANYQRLWLNTRGIANVKTINKALGWIERNALLADRLYGKSDTARLDENRLDTGEVVAVTTLDEFKLRDVNFIKLDLEGYEYFALHGMRETLQRCHPIVLIEEKDELPQHYGLPLSAAREYLVALGMKVVKRYKIDVLLDWNV